MIKRIFLFILVFLTWFHNTFAAPDVNCEWLPWCESWGSFSSILWKLADFIWSFLVQYVAVFAVIALMISWIMYILSNWDEERTKKAKSWIIWSLVWVFLSVSAWFIINFINNFSLL